MGWISPAVPRQFLRQPGRVFSASSSCSSFQRSQPVKEAQDPMSLVPQGRRQPVEVLLLLDEGALSRRPQARRLKAVNCKFTVP